MRRAPHVNVMRSPLGACRHAAGKAGLPIGVVTGVREREQVWHVVGYWQHDTTLLRAASSNMILLYYAPRLRQLPVGSRSLPEPS